MSKLLIDGIDVEVIPCLYAGNFSSELEDWCVEHDIHTHYDSSITWVEDEDNPLADYCRSKNIPLPCKVAVEGT